MFPRQMSKIGGAVVGAILIKHGDDYLTAQNNAQILLTQAESLKQIGLTITSEQANSILNRPSLSQQAVKPILDVLKDKLSK
jgi:hypothetical protein